MGSSEGVAIYVASGSEALRRVPQPRSSTQCELVALRLASSFPHVPSVILTDSLCSLQLIQSWGARSTAQVLSTPDRLEVRQFLYAWDAHPSPPRLEKVKAHDEAGRLAGNLKTMGNEMADALAKRAAAPEVTAFSVDRRFADAVEIFDSADQPVLNLKVLEDLWWSRQRSLGATRRAWIGILYPETFSFDWEGSVWVFRPPSIKDAVFATQPHPRS